MTQIEEVTAFQTSAPARNASPPELPGGIVEVVELSEPPVDRTAHTLSFVRRVDVSKEGDGTAFLHVLKDTTSHPHHFLLGFTSAGDEPRHRRRDSLDHYVYARDLNAQRLFAAVSEVLSDETRHIERARHAQGLDTQPITASIKIPQKVARIVNPPARRLRTEDLEHAARKEYFEAQKRISRMNERLAQSHERLAELDREVSRLFLELED